MAVSSSDDRSQSSKGRGLSPLRHRDFRIFWTALLLSSVGSQFTTVAIAWQIYELTNSPLQLGLIGLARAVPQIGILLFGGLLADAMNRRRLMMRTQASLFCVSGILALITFAGRTTSGTLYGATMLLALFNSLESPSRQALVANLVPREDLARATALTNTQRYIAVIAGPSIAGLVLGFLGPGFCYGVDAVSWLVMLFSLTLIRTELPDRGGWRTVTLDSLRAGLTFVWGHAVIFPLLVMDLGANIFGTARALLPIYARDILAVGPKGMGVLYAASAVGSLLGAASFARMGHVRRAGRGILTGVALYGVCIVLFSRSHVYILSVLFLMGVGFGDMISAILRATINQLATPDELRGRMASINSIFTNSGPQLGQFQAGALAALVGAQLSVMTGGLIILSIVAILTLWFPHVREFQIDEKKPSSDT